MDGDIVFQINNQAISASDFNHAVLPNVRVFNRDTVERAVLESASGQLPPVFYIGEDSVVKQNEIEDLREQEAHLLAEIAGIQAEKKTSERLFEELCTNKAQEIKLQLTRQSGGSYNNYNSRMFKASADRLILSGLEILHDDLRDRYRAITGGVQLPKLSEVSEPPIDVFGLMEKVRAALLREVSSNKLEELLDRPDVTSWIATGMPLHQKYGESTCLFCGNGVSSSRLAAINSHFNDELKALNSELSQLALSIDSAKRKLSALGFPAKSELYPHLSAGYEAALTRFSAFQSAMGMFFEFLSDAIQAKRDLPFTALNLADYLGPKIDAKNDGILLFIFKLLFSMSGSLAALWAESALEKVSEIIKSHNDLSDKFSAGLEKAQKALECDYVSQCIDDYRARHLAIQVCSDSEKYKKESLASAREMISQLEREIVEHRRPADELNVELEAYLGHNDIKFEVLDAGYRVSRKGEPAFHLSDGEKTAIAFMYFLKSLEGNDFDIEDGVVVIDDPISSLDSNSIYSAFSFMKDRLGNVGQLFVLTHNFTFFRLVKNWLNHLANLGQSPKTFDKAKSKDVYFYMLRVIRKDDVRQGELLKLDELLFRYESDYHYLFSLVYAAASEAGPNSFDRYYSLPNISRRMLEVVFAFKDPLHIGRLHEQLENFPYEPASTKTRVLRFLHVNSHGDKIGEFEHDVSLLSEANSVMLDVLRLVRALDAQHYERMVQSIGMSPLDLDAIVS